MSSPFTDYGRPARHHGGPPAPGFYWNAAPVAPQYPPYQTRECETRGIGTGGRMALGVLVGAPLGWLLLCLIAVTAPVSVPALFAVAFAVAVLRPKRGTGKTRPTPARPRQRRGRPATAPAWSAPYSPYKR